MAGLLPYAAVLIGFYALRSAWAAILLYHAGVLVLLAVRRRHLEPRALFRGWRPGAALWLAGGGALTGPLFVLLWESLARPDLSLDRFLERHGLEGPSLPLFLLYYAIVHPFLEHAFWQLARAPETTGLHADDLAYAGYHALVLATVLRLPWVVGLVAALILVSWLWRRVRLRYRGSAVSLASHVAADAGISLAVWVLVRRLG